MPVVKKQYIFVTKILKIVSEQYLKPMQNIALALSRDAKF